MVDQTAGDGIEWVDIVSEENEVIAQASRAQMRAQCLRHRATYIVVHDGMGKILVQRRTESKDFMPGMLDATAGGVVQSGEDLLESAVVKRKRSSASLMSRSPSTANSTSKISTAAYGVDCSAACRTVRLPCRKRKWMKCSG